MHQLHSVLLDSSVKSQQKPIYNGPTLVGILPVEHEEVGGDEEKFKGG